MLIVQKYGGSSLKSPELILAVAKRISQSYKKGNSLIVVVSAMGNTTNELINLANQISRHPLQRELDMLLTTGERVSMSLLSMALNDLDVPAISFTGSQAGVITDESHNDARIVDIRPQRIKLALEQKKVVVLAGFQGVTHVSKEITTLGRGGSDTTAVAMAAHFGAERCEMLKDVDGVFSADPKVVSNAKLVSAMSYEHLVDMTFWGSKVLHHRAAELALNLKVPLFIGPSHSEQGGTLVKGDTIMYEGSKIKSINSHQLVREILVKEEKFDYALKTFSDELAKKNVPMLNILSSKKSGNEWAFLITGPKENMVAAANAFNGQSKVKVTPEVYSSVTVTGHGMASSQNLAGLLGLLSAQNIHCTGFISGTLSSTFIVNESQREQAIRALHTEGGNN